MYGVQASNNFLRFVPIVYSYRILDQTLQGGMKEVDGALHAFLISFKVCTLCNQKEFLGHPLIEHALTPSNVDLFRPVCIALGKVFSEGC